MNITLKNIKYMASLSEETHCFSADVWVDGKKMFGVKNAGHGGGDEVYGIKGGVEHVNTVYREIDEELGKDMAPQSDNAKALDLPELPNCLEFEVCNIINQWLDDKEIKKVMRTVAYIVGDELFTVKVKPTHENIGKVKQQSWWKDTGIVLNGMPMEDLRPIFDKVYFKKKPVGGTHAA